MKRLFLIIVMVLCNSSAAESTREIVMRSYFGNGFGKVVEQNGFLKKYRVKVLPNADPQDQWYFFSKRQENWETALEKGIKVAFGSSEVAEFCTKHDGNAIELHVTGYETITSEGEVYELSDDVSDQEFVSLSAGDFNILRKFVVLSIDTNADNDSKTKRPPHKDAILKIEPYFNAGFGIGIKRRVLIKKAIPADKSIPATDAEWTIFKLDKFGKTIDSGIRMVFFSTFMQKEFLEYIKGKDSLETIAIGDEYVNESGVPEPLLTNQVNANAEKPKTNWEIQRVFMLRRILEGGIYIPE